MDQAVKAVRCPFVYADGHQCKGHVWRAKAYGPFGGPVRKVRLHCSEQGDHNWNNRNSDAMAFYPDELPDAIRADVLALFQDGVADVELAH